MRKYLFSWAIAAGTTICIVAAIAPGCVMLNPTDPYKSVGAFAGRHVAAMPVRQLPEGPLSLSGAISIALANNPDVAAIGYEVDAAQAQRDMAAAQVFPTLHVVGGYSNYLDDQRLLAARKSGESGVFTRNIFSGDIVVSIPLFTGGRITSEVRAAELLQKAAEHRLARSREELVFNVSSVYYGILASWHIVESLEFSQKTLEEHLRRVDDLIAGQKAAKVDRLRTEVRLADIRQNLVQARNVQAIQMRVLANLMGVEDQKQELEVNGKLTSQLDASVSSAEEALARAMQHRSDYLAAKASLEAQAKAMDAARASYWPTISLQGSYGGRWAAEPSEHPLGTSTSEDVGRAGLVLDIPLFEGGRLGARVREQTAKLAAAQERLRRMRLQIRLEVETALLNVNSSRDRVSATEKAIEQAEESLRIEREKYDLGKGANIDVLDAQSALLEAQTSYYRALTDYNTSLAQLKLAIGEE